jgi:hypothetical protein
MDFLSLISSVTVLRSNQAVVFAWFCHSRIPGFLVCLR